MLQMSGRRNNISCRRKMKRKLNFVNSNLETDFLLLKSIIWLNNHFTCHINYIFVSDKNELSGLYIRIRLLLY